MNLGSASASLSIMNKLLVLCFFSAVSANLGKFRCKSGCLNTFNSAIKSATDEVEACTILSTYLSCLHSSCDVDTSPFVPAVHQALSNYGVNCGQTESRSVPSSCSSGCLNSFDTEIKRATTVAQSCKVARTYFKCLQKSCKFSVSLLISSVNEALAEKGIKCDLSGISSSTDSGDCASDCKSTLESAAKRVTNQSQICTVARAHISCLQTSCQVDLTSFIPVFQQTLSEKGVTCHLARSDSETSFVSQSDFDLGFRSDSISTSGSDPRHDCSSATCVVVFLRFLVIFSVMLVTAHISSVKLSSYL